MNRREWMILGASAMSARQAAGQTAPNGGAIRDGGLPLEQIGMPV